MAMRLRKFDNGTIYFRRKILHIISAIATMGMTCVGHAGEPADRRLRTYANPVDLPYRFQPETVIGREAADPTIVRFNGRYWLFASHSKGYWWSYDLLEWNFITPTGFDVDKYAPTAAVIDGRLYLTASDDAGAIWTTDDPMTGHWRVVSQWEVPGDPALFQSSDGRVFIYGGLSPDQPLKFAELDRRTLQPLSAFQSILQSRDTRHRGWEVSGDKHDQPEIPTWIEGAWMTEYHNRYYLEYSGPGTEYKTYANGLLVSEKPEGPFSYADYSPFAYKPTGFITGAGHGSTFIGANNDWWHMGTMTISQRFSMERRLGLFPAQFSRGGELTVDTYLGDYPHYIDGAREPTGWMLLSRGKAVLASSVLPGFSPERAVDEDVRTWWSARSGEPGEWFQVDLGESKTVQALQINFADQDAKLAADGERGFAYTVVVSENGTEWSEVIDKSESQRDAPHDYQVLLKSKKARYVRIINTHVPDFGKFSIYDFRIFGNSSAPLPAKVTQATAIRNVGDPRRAEIHWRKVKAADFYIVRVGIRPDLLNQNFQVYDGVSSLSIGSLNVDREYYFAIDAVNERGINRGEVINSIK